MSVESIRRVVRQHATNSGATSQQARKLSHEDAMAIVREAHEHQRLTGAERAELIAALNLFAGGDGQADAFDSPTDRAALASAAVEGIETAAAFLKQSPRDQRDFLYLGVILGGGERVGFTRTRVAASSLPAEIRTRIEGLVDDEYQSAGDSRFKPAESLAITVIRRAGGTYGYTIDFSFESRDATGAWYGSLLVGEHGARLKRQGAFEPNHPDT